jgi:outer membrane protein OmpA-like peptidoglycan-associated protein
MTMKNVLKTTAGMAAIALALSGCMSTPDPSPRLLAAEATLQQAKANPATFESGRAPLEKAEISLRQARDFYMTGRDDDYIHSIRMGESYVALAEAQGDQLEANRKIASLNRDRADVVSQARTRQVNVAEAATVEAEARATRAVADSATAETGRLAAEARTTALLAELATYEQKKTDLGVTLILRDLQFGSASSTLTSGARGRLAPLAAFLAKKPDAKIQIAGHTDSQGTESNNADLSNRRAWAVAEYLNSTGVDINRITSVGRGEANPTATNDTAAGRAINRRVEVTILD